jgi:hypothetical protein
VLLPVKKSVLYLLLALCIAAVAVSVVSIVIATRPAEKPVDTGSSATPRNAVSGIFSP